MSLQASGISPAARYNYLLKKRPLLTKIVTGAVLNAASELISQLTTQSKEDNEGEKRSSGSLEKLKQLIQKPRYFKLIAMLLYGGLVNAPISHFCYKWITYFTDRRVAAKWKRLAQLCGSWFVVSPIQVFFLITALTLVNLDAKSAKLSQSLQAVKANLRSKYAPMLSSSIVSSTAFVSIAQQYIAPEKWSVFLSFAYAILNTGQNIYMKANAPKDDKKRTD